MGRVECTDAGVTLAEQGPQGEDQLLRHRPRLKKPPSGGSNFGAASASPPSRFERLTSLKPPALPGDIYLGAPSGDRWFSFMCAIAVWVYLTADHLDGMQARRAGSSSNVGAILDHVCDFINGCMIML